MAENNNLLKERVKILNELNRLAETGASKTSDAYNQQLVALKKVNTALNKISATQQANRDNAKEMESFANGLSSVYRTQQKEIKKQAAAFYDISGNIETALARGSELSGENKRQARIVNNMLANYKKQSDIARQIAELSQDDVIAKNELQNQFDDISVNLALQQQSINTMTRVGQDFLDIQGQIEDSIQAQREDASRLSNLTKEQKSILEEQAQVFESMKKKVDALGSTLTTFLRRPQALIGALVIGLGKAVGKFGEINRELGQSFLQGLNSSTVSATALGFIFDDTAGTVRELASEFGDVDAATFGTQANIGLMAMNMGISNKEAVGLTASFARMNGGSKDIAADMIKTTQEFASQNGIIPAALMQDLAGATEEFALFGKDGGENILRAAGYAQKLGVNMKTLSGLADNLLDFESSITKELELGAMLGKNINLNKARELAYQGDIEGATKATLAELGGIEAFNRMDYFQKKATADLLGTSVAELQKMADNQGKAATLGDVVNEKFSKMGEIINGGLNKWLGTGLQGLGGMITMTGQVGMGFSAMGTSIGGVVRGTGQILKNLLGMVAGPVLKGLKAVGGALANSGVGKKVGGFKDKLLSGVGGGAKPDVPSGDGGDGASKFMKSISKIKMSEVLKGAAAMLVVAAAVFVFGKAVQEFMKVSWEAVGMAVVSMLALVGAVALLGAIMSSGVGAVAIVAGAAAMLLIAASVLVLGHALQAIGTGFEMMANGIGTLMPQLMSVAATIGGLVLLIPAITLLSYSIMGLSASLVALGLAGIVAAPGLMALGAVGAITQGLNSLFGGGEDEAAGGEGEDKSQLLIDEIKGLRSDLNSGKIAVFMDGEKVTSKVASVVDKIGGNSYAM